MTKSENYNIELNKNMFGYPSYRSRQEMINNMDGYHIDLLQTAKKKHIIDKKADYSILVVGAKGSGKTTWGIQTCWFWDEEFTLKKNLIYYPQEMDTKINDVPMGGAILLDEGILLAYSANATTKENKKFRQRFNIFRNRHHLLILCVPKLEEVQKSMVDDMNSVVFIDDRKTKGNKRVWRWYTVKQVNKIYKRIKKEGWPQNSAFDSVMSFKYGHFDSRVPFALEYEKLKEDGVKNFNNNGEEKKDGSFLKSTKIKMEIAERMRELGYKHKEMAKLFGCTRAYVSQMFAQKREQQNEESR